MKGLELDIERARKFRGQRLQILNQIVILNSFEFWFSERNKAKRGVYADSNHINSNNSQKRM